jgi:hypothetical protein
MIISYWRCSNNEMAVLYINPYYTQHHMVKITLFCSEFKLILYLLTMYIYCVYIYWQCTYIVFIFTDNVHILCLYLLTMYIYCVYIYWQCTDIVFIFTDNVQILCLYLLTMYIYCVYLVMLKSLKQLPNCLERAESIVVLIVFNGVLCDISIYTVIVFRCSSTWIKYQKSFIRSMTK